MTTSTMPSLPPPRRRRRWPYVLLVLVVVSALIVVFGVWLRNGPLGTLARSEGPVEPLFTIPELDVASGSAIPAVPSAVPAARPGPNDPRARWLDRVSSHTDIPQRALQAYVNAAAITAKRDPSCHLTWATLAGVGRIESDHGQHHGDSINADGTEAFPIIGPTLDGSPGVQGIHDTDHGRLDGDTVWDHAVGPMQFLPSRWLAEGERASGDGHAPDPQNIDDAALTAATYLCTSGNLAVPAHWWRAAFHYNNSVTYGRAVFSAADAYAKASTAQR
ncbi:MAG TPA: murein transglycosylase [Pseudonocardiaceae bacterium]